MCTYLKPYSGTYYFRRIVPEEIRHLFPTSTGKPRTEWRVSLRTKNREEAKRLLPAHVARTNALIDQARVAVARVEQEPSFERSAASQAIIDDMELASIESAEQLAAIFANEERRTKNCPLFAEEMRLRAAKATERRELEERAENRELLRQLRDGKHLGLLELFDRYAAVPGRRVKSMRQWRSHIASLVSFLGHDNALAVTERQLVDWRNSLRDVPNAKGKMLDAKTINGSYLGAVKAMFRWAKDDGAIATNPALEVQPVKVIRKVKLRDKDLTLDEAKLILRATLKPAAGREGADLRNAKRWLPWLMAYSGARIAEVAQLRKADILVEDGIHAMRFTPEAGPIKTNEARTVPLHSDIVSQGFLDWVASRPEGPLFFDPAKRRSDDAINRQANRLGSKLASWVRSLGIDDAALKPNHAWRHLFNTLAVRHDLHPRAARAILGHAPGNVNESYGKVPLDTMAANIEKLPPFLGAS